MGFQMRWKRKGALVAELICVFSGSGTLADPFVLANCCELQGIADSNGKYYELGNDIDCNDTSNWNAGAGF